MRILKGFVILLTLLLLAFWGIVAVLLHDYPRGTGMTVLSPDGSHEAVALQLTDRTLRGILPYLALRTGRNVPESRRLRLEIVQGRFGGKEDVVVDAIDLPDRYAPSPDPKQWIRWNPDGMSAVFLLTPTNLVLHTAGWTPEASPTGDPGRSTP
jgi:hypothetical protein